MRCAVSVAIPTYGREQALLETIESLLCLEGQAAEILIIDQTPVHEAKTEARLGAWNEKSVIRWIRLAKPSIPKAMNEALRRATEAIVLFVDDDVIPLGELVRAHAEAYERDDCAAVNGQVLQPGQEESDSQAREQGRGLRRDLVFGFNSSIPAYQIWSCIACNLSVQREAALRIGGFDEAFVGAAYRFETEFCRRLARAGGRTKFDPRARVRHLKASTGGTRAWGHHLRTLSAAASVGDYYFAFVEGRGAARWLYILGRMLREVRTRFHLTHPWWIPVKVVGEVRGVWLAVALYRRRNDKAAT